MKNINCNIVKDILPLYFDKVVSKDTIEMVEEHLKSCENCQKEASVMKKDFVMPVNQSIQLDEAKMLKKFKMHFRKKKVLISIVSFIIAFGVMGAVIFLLTYPKLYIDYDGAKISVDVDDGNVYAEYTGNDAIAAYAIYPVDPYIDGEEKYIVIFYYSTTFWDKYFTAGKGKSDINKTGFTVELGEAAQIDEVYYGKYDGGEVYEPSELSDMHLVWSK
ncbi:MAG: zf-HC2 domain-containing protein [Lachnospiraceae bacterium]|nr:zf-HC2 domain-containing protein [Lachnospiraceae bacterium]MDE6232370.1 zf-HC2 domain-containing protein [Lachnospiraceae bacterium]MDE6252261.1 zf-HC2 domain-containing protein [Lachnospiraceae bacterium]